MYDLSDDSQSIWKELKQGSLGTVLWAFRGDERVVHALSESLSRLGSKDALAGSLEYPVSIACNCIGQVALHQFAAEESASPHVEPRDSRWSPLRVLTPEVPILIARSIAYRAEFTELLEGLLARTIKDIMSGEFKRVYDLQFVAESVEVYQRFLIHAGVALSQAISEAGKTLPGVLGEVSKLNGGAESPLYPFTARRKKPGSYG